MIVLEVDDRAFDACAVLVLDLAVDDALHGAARLSGDRTKGKTSDCNYKRRSEASGRLHEISIRRRSGVRERIAPHAWLRSPLTMVAPELGMVRRLRLPHRRGSGLRRRTPRFLR